MELLPKSHKEFTSAAYWDSFFKKRGAKAFEWYGEYNNLCGILHKYAKTGDKVLMVGCGNSRLSEDMYDVGYHNIANIDISDTVIQHMTERNAKKRGDMTFEKMDVTQMTYDDEAFSVAIDKGTLDALAVDEEEATLTTVNAMFKDVSRVLRLGGRYIIISLLQDQVVQVLMRYFGESCWPIRVHRVDGQMSNGGEPGEDDFHLPVFAVVLTKFKAMPNMPQIVEMCSGEGPPQRLDSTDQLISTVKEMQYYGLVRQQLSTKKVQEDQVEISLYSELGSSARYTMWVVDSKLHSAGRFAIFIVPRGREVEWIFSSDAGRRQLSQSAGFERLVVVALSRDHEYKDMDTIRAELSSKVMELAPASYRKGVEVPFLSAAGDLGSRTVCHRGHSELSGDYIVEDAEGEEGHVFRRLIFMSNQNVVQSEVRLVAPPAEKTKKKKGRKKASTSDRLLIDKSYLACGHHHSMVAGLAFLPDRVTRPRVVLVGLGGGPLAAFLNQNFPQVQLEAVEIDGEMAKVASEWFGFEHNASVAVHIADGLHFISQLAHKGEKRDVVMFDIDSKDTSIGLSCPPPAFLTPDFLRTTADLIDDEGVFVLNFVCRDQTLQKSMLARIADIFPNVFFVDIPEEVNKVIFASKSARLAAGSAGKPDCAQNADNADSTNTSESDDTTNHVEKSDCAEVFAMPCDPDTKVTLTCCAQTLNQQIKRASSLSSVELVECLKDLQALRLK